MTNNIRKALLTAALICAAPAVMAIGYNYDGQQVLSLDANIQITDKADSINLSLRDSDVKQVLRMFADKAGLNVIFHSSVSGSVTLDLVDVSLNDAFKLVLKITGHTYYLDDKTLIIMSKKAAANEQFASRDMTILPVKYVDASRVAEFLNKNIFAKKRPGYSTTEIATVNTAANELIIFGMDNDVQIAKKILEQFDKKPNQATFVVNHTTPQEMASMICNMLTPGETSTSGEQPDMEDEEATGFAVEEEAEMESGEGTDTVILGENLVACTLTGANAVAGSTVPFSPQNLKISYYPQRGTVKVFGGSQAQIDYIAEFIKENDTKQPQAYVDISIIELNEDGSRQFSNNWSASMGNIQFNANTDGTTIGHVSGGHMKTKLSWDMNYLLQTAKARVLANPKLVVTNGKEAVLDLTSDYVESVDVEYLQTGSTTASAVAQKTYNIGSDKGLKVSLTPFISKDGYVTVNVKPEYSTELEQVKAMEFGVGAGTEYTAATLLSRRNIDVKNVRIKDGETLVIGGLIQEQTHKTVTKIPILGDIPGIGAAFRSSSNERIKTELVILITPKIIKDNEDIGINTL